ncbi:MAG: hypothetical protein FJ206_05885 [Gemmatimonadetes bacterium]|nr:hypothetical protein [Gemmatimonadota bacterium]
MNKQVLALFIPILALSIPVVAIIFSSLTKMAKFKADAQARGLPNPETDARMAALEDDVAMLRRELSETQERLDFTERLLAQRSEVNRG